VTGSFDSSGSPAVEILVFGPDPALHCRISAVVDTGFTGFLLMPTLLALPLGLIPHATIDVTLADGSTQSKFVCIGGIEFDGQTQTGVIILEEQSTEALIGMEFLKALRLTLIVDAAAYTLELRPSSR
jgi:clan AA aspartic protease